MPGQPGDRMILFGTGKFLEDADKTSTSDQTIYALKDVPTVTTGPVIANVRSAAVKVRTLAAGSDPDDCPADSCRTVTTGAAPSWATESGWLIDLPDDGERVNVDPQLQSARWSSPPTYRGRHLHGGRLLVAQLPRLRHGFDPRRERRPGEHQVRQLDHRGRQRDHAAGGKVVTIVTTADNQQLTKNTPVPTTSFAGRRVSWRELIKE